MMARVLKTTKRNALIVSVLFFLFYTAFLFWNYYNIDDKPDFKRGTEEDDYRNLQVTIDAGIVADNPQIGEKEAGPLGIFMAADNEKTFNELWLDVERKVSKNRQAEDSKDAPSLIHPMFSHLYVPNADGMFTCLLDGRLVHHSQINDDYCDCLDGTDEPGTSACSDGRFYCKYQSMLKGLMWIKSSRVKDGVCDCPDGSDEPIKSDGGCLDKTEDMRKQEGEHLQLLAKGRRIRKEWIEEVRENVPVLKNELYGRRGEFYKVETSPCLSVKVNKYSYKICPFGESTQESYGSKTVIGRWPRWLKQRGYDIVKSSWQRMSKSEDFVLLSSGGDHSGCPDGKSRESMFVFSCDVQNRVVDISEREKCLYEIDFRTPAAC